MNNERFDINWKAELHAYVMEGQWNSMRLGPPPLHTGCRAPADLVARYFPDGKPAYGPNGPRSEIHKPISYLEETNADLDELTETKDAEAAIVRLAELSDFAYARKRKQAAAGLAMSVGLLDKLVAAQRAKQTAEAEPAPLYEHWNVEPWPGSGRWRHPAFAYYRAYSAACDHDDGSSGSRRAVDHADVGARTSGGP